MLTRREWLRLAGAGVGLGVLSSRDVEAVLEQGQGAAGSARRFPAARSSAAS